MSFLKTKKTDKVTTNEKAGLYIVEWTS